MNNESTPGGQLDGEYPDFSVLLATYRNDDCEFLNEAIESVVCQTIEPDEIVLVVDGPVGKDLDSILESWKNRLGESFVIRRLPENQGLGNALRVGVEKCSNEYIARMDADDVSVETRFEVQLNFLEQNPGCDIVGGYIEEIHHLKTKNKIREVPQTQPEILELSRFRSPMNHVTVMFRKEAIIEAGNYRSAGFVEDYDLWRRLIQNGASMANIPVVLVKVRAGQSMYRRRGGVQYAKDEISLQLEFLKSGFTNIPVFLINIITRVPFRMVPQQIRGWYYTNFVRHDTGSNGSFSKEP